MRRAAWLIEAASRPAGAVWRHATHAVALRRGGWVAVAWRWETAPEFTLSVHETRTGRVWAVRCHSLATGCGRLLRRSCGAMEAITVQDMVMLGIAADRMDARARPWSAFGAPFTPGILSEFGAVQRSTRLPTSNVVSLGEVRDGR